MLYRYIKIDNNNKDNGWIMSKQRGRPSNEQITDTREMYRVMDEVMCECMNRRSTGQIDQLTDR